MENLTPKQILDKAMGMRDFYNAADEKKILKAMKEYAKQEVAAANSDSGGKFTADNKAMDDHEFNLHRHWTADDTNDFDGPTIKHFQD